jgi:hypothetical protein
MGGRVQVGCTAWAAVPRYEVFRRGFVHHDRVHVLPARRCRWSEEEGSQLRDCSWILRDTHFFLSYSYFPPASSISSSHSNSCLKLLYNTMIVSVRDLLMLLSTPYPTPWPSPSTSRLRSRRTLVYILHISLIRRLIAGLKFQSGYLQLDPAPRRSARAARATAHRPPRR